MLHLLLLSAIPYIIAQAPGYPHGGGPCKSEWDCSLGGYCNATSSTCVCDDWVTGAQCDLLNLAPAVDATGGLQVPGYYAWGGHALLSPTDGRYHGLFSFLCRHGNLDTIESLSSIWHATSDVPEGPFSLTDMVAQPYSHNAMLTGNPAGGYLLYHIGDSNEPDDQWSPCYNSTVAQVGTANISKDRARPLDSTGIHVRAASDFTGPWTTAMRIDLDTAGSWAPAGANGGNPAPLFLDNGSVLLYFSANPCPAGWGNISPDNNCIGVAIADSWNDTYSISAANALPVTHPESEDPFVFRDARGHFHLLTNVNNDHTRCAQGVPCGGHAWSYDGLTFSNLTIGAFGPVIRFQNGSFWYNAYVERPQVLQAADGTPIAFYVGMGRSSYEDCCNWAQLFCSSNLTNCGPTLPPPPPPPTRVRYSLGSLCLSTNASFPCPGGWADSCPVFLASCGDASAVWIVHEGGDIENEAHPGTFINIDCDSCAPHTLAKIYDSASPIVFTGGQLAASACAGMCLNGGEGPAVPPCKDGEDYLPNAQLQLEQCSSLHTQGWQQVIV